MDFFIYYMEHLCVVQRNQNSDGCTSYCQKSVKLREYVNKLLYYNKHNYMYRYTMHIHMIGYFCHKKYKYGITCVTHFHHACEMHLVMDSFLS